MHQSNERAEQDAGTGKTLPLWMVAGAAAAIAGLATAGIGLIVLNGGPGGAWGAGEGARLPESGLTADGVPTAPTAAQLAELDETFDDLGLVDFTLTNHRGEPVTQAVFDGEWSVLMFVFTNCPLACPGMFAAALEVEEQTADLAQPPRFVAISVDPANDTPEVLAAYFDERGLDPDRWTLATGDIEEVRRVLDGLGLAIETNESFQIELEDGASMANIDHPTRMVLVGPERGVRGYLSYSDPRDQALLIAKLRQVGR